MLSGTLEEEDRCQELYAFLLSDPEGQLAIGEDVMLAPLAWELQPNGSIHLGPELYAAVAAEAEADGVPQSTVPMFATGAN